MAFEWKTVRAADFIEFNPRLSIKKRASFSRCMYSLGIEVFIIEYGNRGTKNTENTRKGF